MKASVEFNAIVFLVVGMILGASAITWGLADETNLPPEEKIINWTEEYYQDSIVNEERDVIGVEVSQLEDSRFPSLYTAKLTEIRLLEKSRENRTREIYISKDGLQTGQLDEVSFTEPKK